MQKLEPSDILDLDAYEKVRDTQRTRVMEIKRPRRVHLGGHMTFLFENADTMR